MEKTNKKSKGSRKYGFFAFLVTVTLLAAIIPQVSAGSVPEPEDYIVKISAKKIVNEGQQNLKVVVIVTDRETKERVKAQVKVTGLFTDEGTTNDNGKVAFTYNVPMTDGTPTTRTISVTAKQISESTGSSGSGGYVSSGDIVLGDGEAKVRDDIDFGFTSLKTGTATKDILIRPELTITFQANTNVDKSELLSLPTPSDTQRIWVIVRSHGKPIDGATVGLKKATSNAGNLRTSFVKLKETTNYGAASFIYTIPDLENPEMYTLVFKAKKDNYVSKNANLKIRISP